MNGQPCIRGMRLTVRRVVEAVALYSDRADLFRNYPELEPDDVHAQHGARRRAVLHGGEPSAIPTSAQTDQTHAEDREHERGGDSLPRSRRERQP